jgi:UPF0042 nucleotide-binding protein
VDADLVFDARCLPNPHFVESLRPLTGHARSVVDYVLASAQSRGFLERVQQLLTYALPLYVHEGKAYLTVAIGCTGGRHRSVVLVEELARRLTDAGHQVTVRHRDVERE